MNKSWIFYVYLIVFIGIFILSMSIEWWHLVLSSRKTNIKTKLSYGYGSFSKKSHRLLIHSYGTSTQLQACLQSINVFRMWMIMEKLQHYLFIVGPYYFWKPTLIKSYVQTSSNIHVLWNLAITYKMPLTYLFVVCHHPHQ